MFGAPSGERSNRSGVAHTSEQSAAGNMGTSPNISMPRPLARPFSLEYCSKKIHCANFTRPASSMTPSGSRRFDALSNDLISSGHSVHGRDAFSFFNAEYSAYPSSHFAFFSEKFSNEEYPARLARFSIHTSTAAENAFSTSAGTDR